VPGLVGGRERRRERIRIGHQIRLRIVAMPPMPTTTRGRDRSLKEPLCRHSKMLHIPLRAIPLLLQMLLMILQDQPSLNTSTW
jgi:hypothetical protein